MGKGATQHVVETRKPKAIDVPPELVSWMNPIGSFSDELVPQARRYYKSHPSTTGQLTAGQFGGAIGYPRPSVTSNEDPLIKEKMRTFPDNHPSFGSVPNLKAMGAPALVFTQGDSTQWESTTRATIDLHKPTLKNRKEGKASVEALFGAGDLYTVPIDSYVAPVGAPPTISRDQRVFKHMGTLSRLGKW
ncbi:hypothetical protein Ctob_002752 [Chrysochromulina tobinii]|uniref:Uncharacterized protein n=1 Tax=Chrysochromulina tobinii TaxID=1460289 RepID=A0A0M0JAS9_9EUKA|nr:hypothetical protein Ctob_002752 [Chrysochromulina tobinii]|eukprot:KOO23590.1 hypothetical protein Ctob_002752 [Chrysochromulina sp. CCMP291]